jgi:hypothetical protein
MRTKQIARDLFYTGKTDITPTEDEELQLKQKYGLEVPYKSTFQHEVDGILAPSEDAEEGFTSTLSKVTSRYLGNLYDEIEDDYNLDITNRDVEKYNKLENNFEAIKKAIYRKVMLSKLPETEKNMVSKRIESSKDINQLLSYLEFGSLNKI